MCLKCLKDDCGSEKAMSFHTAWRLAMQEYISVAYLVFSMCWEIECRKKWSIARLSVHSYKVHGVDEFCCVH